MQWKDMCIANAGDTVTLRNVVLPVHNLGISYLQYVAGLLWNHVKW